MSTNLRIHIVPVGFEFRRATEPIIRMQADKVYFIRHKEDDNASKYFSQIKNELTQNYRHIQVKEIFFDIWDFLESIEEFRKIIQAEKGNHIYINVSTGTKITAIAGMVSCMLWDAHPYYAPIQYLAKESKIPPTEYVYDSNILPIYNIKKPKENLMKIMSLLQSYGGVMRKSKMIEELEVMKLLRKTDESGKELKGPAKHSQLRALLDQLENEWSFVKVEASGRRSEVSITEEGETALRIFGCENIK